MAIKFFYNGIKGADKKLQKAVYSDGVLTNYPAGTITIYARGCSRFTKEIHEHFTVKNDSDSMSDYFEGDTIRVLPCHPLYKNILTAMNSKKSRKAV